MKHLSVLEVRPEVAAALADGRAVVALESTVIAHGLPWPLNLETARAVEAAVRAEGAIPATIAIWQGRPIIGLNDDELAALAHGGDVHKASSRDLGLAIAKRWSAATTVAATIFMASRAGIRLMATGGIGGAHPPASSWDISADLRELARTPVAVVCAGAKSVLDIPRTLEILETEGVPVLGYGVGEFPAFYVRSSGEPAAGRVDTPEEAAAAFAAHWSLGGAGAVLAQAVDVAVALSADELNAALAEAERLAQKARVRGPALTPFLLARLAEITQGKTLHANRSLLVANARLAARVARALGASPRGG